LFELLSIQSKKMFLLQHQKNHSDFSGNFLHHETALYRFFRFCQEKLPIFFWKQKNVRNQ